MFTTRINVSMKANSLDTNQTTPSLVYVHTVCYRDILKDQQMTHSRRHLVTINVAISLNLLARVCTSSIVLSPPTLQLNKEKNYAPPKLFLISKNQIQIKIPNVNNKKPTHFDVLTDRLTQSVHI